MKIALIGPFLCGQHKLLNTSSATSPPAAQEHLSTYEHYKLCEENSSIQFTGFIDPWK